MTKFIIEQHTNGFVAYPLGIQGVVVGQGDTREEALEDARSALEFHIETFGAGVVEQHFWQRMTRFETN
jgi:predicted RNase H-like HicB family nuclease